MLLRYNTWLVSLLLFMTLNANTVFAQGSSFEFWPETDIWYRLNSSWRLSAFVPLTKYRESQTRDLNIYLQGDFVWGHTRYLLVRRLRDENRAQTMKPWMIRGGYMKGWSLEENGTYSEHAALAELHKRIPLKGNLLLSQRVRTDFRWLGQDNDYSYRFRYRLMIEKEYTSGNTSIVPYVNAEPFWDSRYSAFNRFRLIGGATVAWKQRFALEGNLTYQNDSESSVQNLYALNIILHLYFERAAAIVKPSDSEQP